MFVVTAQVHFTLHTTAQRVVDELVLTNVAARADDVPVNHP